MTFCGSDSVSPGGHVFEAHGRRDVAGAHFLDFRALAGVHLQQPADALVAVLVRHEHLVARVQRAGVHPEEREVAHERVVQNLEGQRREGLGVVRLAGHRFAAFALTLDGRYLHGRGHVFDDGVEHRLDALVLEGRTAGHQTDFVLERAGAQALLDLRIAQGAAFQVFVEQILGAFGGRFDHLAAPFLAFFEHGRRNVAILEFHPLGFFIPPDGLHLDQIDHADEAILGADRQLDRHRVAAQPGSDLLDAAQKVRARPVHLVDERHPRHAVLVHLAPDGFRLRLHTGYRAVDRHGRIEHAQAPFHLDGEIDVSRRIDDVDAVLGEALVHPLPETGGRRGRDGDAALLFLFHVVHDGRAVMHFADFVRHAGIEQDALGRGGLSRVDVRRDTDVAVSLDGRRTCHISSRRFNSGARANFQRGRSDPVR